VLVPAGGSYLIKEHEPGGYPAGHLKLSIIIQSVSSLVASRNPVDQETGLLEIMELTVLYRGKVLYQGPVIGLPERPSTWAFPSW